MSARRAQASIASLPVRRLVQTLKVASHLIKRRCTVNHAALSCVGADGC